MMYEAQIAGLGDEARGGPGWIAVRHDDQVIMLRLAGPAATATPPAALLGLAQTALGRISTPAA